MCSVSVCTYRKNEASSQKIQRRVSRFLVYFDAAAFCHYVHYVADILLYSAFFVHSFALLGLFIYWFRSFSFILLVFFRISARSLAHEERACEKYICDESMNGKSTQKDTFFLFISILSIYFLFLFFRPSFSKNTHKIDAFRTCTRRRMVGYITASNILTGW